MTLAFSFHAAWLLSFGPAVVAGLLLLALLARRRQITEYGEWHRELGHARERGSHEARLQHPEVDLSKCIGCGACVRACPEDGVLALLHGQAVVVHGARCVGHAACAAACPTGAIALTFGDLSQRRDLPAIKSDLESATVPGLFLSGEISGFALVRTAIAQGVEVADAVARRVAVRQPNAAGVLVTVGGEPVDDSDDAPSHDVLDLLVVGAGPAGLACSLRAKERELRCLTIEQEPRIGGTVAAYPRKKMVMTQPVELPLYGKLPKLTYQKEDLIEIWEQVTNTHKPPLRLGVRLLDLTRDETTGVFTAKTSDGEIRARCVCLALGRRGSPRKLGVPGEDLPKVNYSLLDAESYRDRKILVVGGGDSAVEAALGLAEQPGNEVTLAYRKKEFFRLKARNDTRVRKAIVDGRLRALFECEVVAIEPQRATLSIAGVADRAIPNDDVFVFAGGDPPFAMLERAGVSFDPKDRPEEAEKSDKAIALLPAMAMVFGSTLALGLWVMWFRSYYGLESAVRSMSDLHRWLRPAGPIGFAFGLAGCLLFAWNLTYLLRRSPTLGRWLPGSLRAWMTTHIFTGLTGLLCIFVHAGFSMRPTVGGHALLALLVVIVTGLVGRYIYSFIPRAANGTESSLDDLRAQLTSVSAEWDRDGRGFGRKVHAEVDHLIVEGRWRPSFWARMHVLVSGQLRLRRVLRHLGLEAHRDGIPDREIRRVKALARKAYALTLLVTHYEEIRGVLSSWRYFHRWIGALMVLLAIAHIITASRYATLRLSADTPARVVRQAPETRR